MIRRSQASCALLCGLMLLVLSAAAYGGPIELRLKSGARWLGQVNDRVKIVFLDNGAEVPFQGKIVRDGDLYLTVEGVWLGRTQKKVIFKSDIVAIETTPADATTGGPEAGNESDESTEPAPDAVKAGSASKSKELLKAPKPGVFVLPLKGMVGLEFRHQEMKKVAAEADKYGPGQIIVLLIDSGGGRVDETEQIHKTLMAIKRDHRLVAWIQKAISAACATALHCDEIYFMTEGTAGSMTAFAGTQSWQGEELERWLKNAGDWAEAGGRSRYIAEAMIHAPLMCSYDKDPETGVVTFHNNLSGQYVLSRPGENLTFNSSNAVHCGFADGIADTKEDLAKLLDLSQWYEITAPGTAKPIGQAIADNWESTVEKANKEIPLLFARYNYQGTGTGDARVVLGKRKSILDDLVKWWERCPNACEMTGVPPKRVLEEEIAEIKRRLSEMNRKR